MKNRCFLFLTGIIYITASALAQDIEVKKFEQLDKDQTAVTSPRKDINGNACGLVKVKMIDDGFLFSGNVIGNVEVKNAEYWVYLSNGTKRLNVKHPNYAPTTIVLADYGINKIAASRTYQLVLKVNSSQLRKSSDNRSVVVFNVKPSDADFYIDNSLQPQEQGGVYAVSLTHGVHYYSIKNGDFVLDNLAVAVNGKMKPVIADLTQFFAALNVDCSTADAEIYVNGIMRGNKSWSGILAPGKVVIEARKTGFQTVSKTLELLESDSVNVTLPFLRLVSGSITVNYLPENADVYVDDAKVGMTPFRMDSLSVGKHSIKISSQYFKDFSQTFTLEEDQNLILEGKLEYKDKFSELYVEAHNGDAEAQYQLAYCYEYYRPWISGYDKTACDPKKAFYWYMKAAEQGYIGGQRQVSICYSNGFGVNKDYAQAFYWAKKCAERDDYNGCYLLGICYAYGHGVEKNIEEAVRWLKKAVILGSGFKSAEELLKELGYEHEIPV